MDSMEHHSRLFEKLHVDHEMGRPRPHKPVMLLSVMSLLEQGKFSDGRILYSPELLEVFGRFFERVRAGNDKRTPFNPFFYLKSEGFWHLHAQSGKEAILSATRTIRGVGQLMELVSHASLDPELMALIVDRISRAVLRDTLIKTYFPQQRQAVLTLCSEEEAIGRREKYDESGDRNMAERVAEPIRDTAFGRVVRRAYDYTCAMCGIRFMLDDVIIVDAAHLIPFAESRDDSPSNGIALCKNHHWLMDRHLIAPGPSRGDDYSKPIWLVSSLLDSRLEAHRACMEYNGSKVIIPREERHHPSPRSLAWRAEHLRS